MAVFENRSPARCLFAPCLLIVAIAFLSGIPLAAQTTTGSILGTVSDASGGVIPGATVTITNTGTAEKRLATTDAAGSYRFVNLLPGQYRMDVEIAGFKRFTREPITLEVQASLRIDAPMQVGAISETVEVSSETPLLQTENTSLSHMVEAKTVEEMPLNGRNVMNLVALAPGVVPGGSTSGAPVGNQGAGHTNNAGWNNYQIGGGIAGHSTAFLDGAPTVTLGSNYVGLIATQEAVQEFRVSTNSISPEYGRFGGGVVNMATKSGSNAFHGSAYEFFRNRVLNANNFFANAAGLQRPAFNQNQYGANITGPVFKDKTFFMFTWERLDQRVGQTTITFVPTAAQRAGDFSATLGGPLLSGGSPVINPCTGQPVLQGQIFDPLTTKNVAGKNCRMPFDGNKIPANRFDGTANLIANTLKYWPLPNASLPGGNYASTVTPGGNQSQYNGRIDQNLSDKQRLFGRFTYWKISDLSLNPFSNSTGNPPSHAATHQFVIGDTYTFTPTMILDVRLSYMRAYYDDKPVSDGKDLAEYGPAWATLNNQVTYRENVSPGVTGLYNFGVMNVTSRHYRNNYTIAPNMTKVSGRHTIKFGADFRLMDYSTGQTTTPSGRFTFTTGMTNIDGTGAATSGNPFASFMLGYAATGTLGTVRLSGQYTWYQGYFVGDTWQVGKNLTFNYGVRWDLPGAYAERHDLATILDPNVPDPLSTAAGIPLKGALNFVASSQYADRTTQKTKMNLFAPRLGMAYRVKENTVLRLGYAISYLPMDLPGGVAPSGSPINGAATAMATSVNGVGLVPLNTLSNPFPQGGVPGTIQQTVLQPSGRVQSYLDGLKGLSISGAIPDQPFAYVQQWNINLQREFRGGFLAEIGYAGAKGTHIPSPNINLNQLDPQYYSMGTALTTPVKNPMAGLLNPTGTLNGPTIAQGQLLRPYPQYTNVSNSAGKVGSSIYHSMQAKIEKRFGAAGNLTANYTWSKNIANTDTSLNFLEGSSVGAYQNYYDLRSERSTITFNMPHRFVASYVIELPFGKGKRFLSTVSGFSGKLLSGWAINGITTFQEGFPLALTAQASPLSQSFGAGTIRPNYVGGCEKVISGPAQSRLSKWFNTACFAQPAAYAFGNEARVDPAIRIAGVNNFDFTIAKNTTITERTSLQFRTELFNLFNRVQFGSPGAQLGAATFGTISSQANQPRLVQFALRLIF